MTPPLPTPPVRVRFAPSPTGALHIGGVRTALYNYLFAKQMGGQFILRIEDTDQTRFVPGAEQYIFDTFAWLGLAFDEGVQEGGPHAPYRQSERRGLYLPVAQQLVAAGHAYYAFDTPDELNAMRQRLEAAGVANPSYNALTRSQMRNSLTLPEAEWKAMLADGVPHAVRVKVPPKEEIRFRDLVRDWVKVHSATLDDKVLLKSDGLPTYHLANIVDDHLMGITHVIRGEEWLPSAPLHVLLYRLLGWEATMPQFAHLPLLLNPDGNGKLSKRRADEYGFPVFPLDWAGTDEKTGLPTLAKGFRESGYLPAALLNFLAFLGWNPGTEKEIFSLNELVDAFSLDRIGLGGARFDVAKAQWYNQQYVHALPTDQLTPTLTQLAADYGYACPPARAAAIVELVRGRLTFPQDAWREAAFLFERPAAYDEATTQGKWNADATAVLADFRAALPNIPALTAETAKATLQSLAEARGTKVGKVLAALRIAVTGGTHGPDLMQSIAILGNHELGERLDRALLEISA